MLIENLRSVHGKFFEWKQHWKRIFALRKRILKANDKTVLFVMTPIHGNIGDHAITKAVSDMLVDLNLNYIEVTSDDLFMMKKIHAIAVMNGKPILVNGGGNLGTLWPELEKIFRKIIKKNKSSRMICLPNTIHYENTTKGKRELQKSAAVYNKHKYLKICAREKISYELVCNLYNDVVLMPDMVLSMDESETEHARSGCLLCLRNDIEKTLDLKESNKYLDELKELFHGAVCITDTDSSDCIPIENRNAAINEKLDEFRSAELVVTDRLHGMIFSAITGTPCIVLNSKSHKITGCYEWIKHLDYITLYKDKESIFDLYNQIPKQCNRYNNDYLQPYFSELKKYIMDMVS